VSELKLLRIPTLCTPYISVVSPSLYTYVPDFVAKILVAPPGSVSLWFLRTLLKVIVPAILQHFRRRGALQIEKISFAL
jgi:hypothetical protein